MKLQFKVTHVNDGPAPFDVTALSDQDEIELRIRMYEHPGLAADDTITVEFDQAHFPVIAEEPAAE